MKIGSVVDGRWSMVTRPVPIEAISKADVTDGD
jgi:hypothetical protein